MGIIEYNTCGDSYAYLQRWTKTAHEHVALRISAPGWYGRTCISWVGFVARAAAEQRSSMRSRNREPMVQAFGDTTV